MKGLLGRKAGMTTIFLENGIALPATVIEVPKNIVLQTKTIEIDGYNALKIGAFDKRDQLATKAELGISKIANTSPKYFTKEIRDMIGFKQGEQVGLDIFEVGEYVDITGISKGKGFQGSIKRHNQAQGPMGHGSKSHRITGSSGDIRGTVKKTKKMPGHMGHEQITMQNLTIIAIDKKESVIIVKGSIPGPNKSFVIVKDSIKLENSSAKITLVDVQENNQKLILLDEAKKYQAEVNTQMPIEEMENIINAAKAIYDKENKEKEDILNEAKELKISNPEKIEIEELKQLVQKAKTDKASKEAKLKVKAVTEKPVVKKETKEDVSKEKTVSKEKPKKENSSEPTKGVK